MIQSLLHVRVTGRGRPRHPRRSRLEICAQIMKILQFNYLSLNEVAFYAGLNYRAAKRYIDFLVERNLVSAMIRDGKTYYIASPKGKRFIKHFEEIRRLIEG
ncbi:MAG: winged helix-turn-helix domain-containing protein [Candidatus Bathyarchaeia archaeon]